MNNARRLAIVPITGSDWVGERGDKWRTHLVGMEAMLDPVDDPLVHALQLDAPVRIADLGCGGGGATLAIARRAPQGSVVHGFDISPSLVEQARGRVAAAEPALAFHVADLATAAPPGAPYDRLASRFGVMFFDDPPRAFDNFVRWLAPGGRFAFAIWGAPAGNPWFTCVRDTVAEVVSVPSSVPDSPGPFRYADAASLVRLLEQAGFVGVASQPWRGPLPVGGPLAATDAATFALASFASFAELLAGLDDDARRRVHASLTARFQPHERDGAVWLDALVHVVTGTRAA